MWAPLCAEARPTTSAATTCAAVGPFGPSTSYPKGEFGVDTWGDDSWKYSGDLGSWCCLSADEQLGLVYVPFTAPTAAYYGGHRPGSDLFSNSLVALALGNAQPRDL